MCLSLKMRNRGPRGWNVPYECIDAVSQCTGLELYEPDGEFSQIKESKNQSVSDGSKSHNKREDGCVFIV